MMITSDH